MSGIYTNGFSSVGAAAGAAYLTLHTGANLRARIQEIGFFVAANTSSSIGLGRPANTPTATTSQLGQAEEPADPASTVNVDTAWGTAPTAPTVFMRKITVPNVTGNGVIWTWVPGSELIVPVSSWLVLWNFGAGAGSVLNGYVKWAE